MDRDVALVLAGGLIGLGSSVVVLVLQRLWSTHDRQSVAERQDLDVTVRALMEWQRLGLGMLGGGGVEDAQARLRELDLHWETDTSLIPDRAAADELLARCKETFLFRPDSGPESILASDRIMKLGDRVVVSARKRRRQLT